MKTIYLAGGCFWGLQKFLDQFKGVERTEVGYANGPDFAPSYQEVCRSSGHAETVKVDYDEDVLRLETLLDYYFMVIDPLSYNRQGMDMGVQGAAWATILSQTVAAVLVVVTLMRSHASYRLMPRRIRLHGTMLAKIVRIGLPAGLQSVMYSVSNVLIQTSINGFDTDVLAGWTAYGELDGLFWMTINAFGVAATTFSAQNFGAGQYDRMRKGVRTSLMQAAVGSGILMVFLWFFGEHLYRLFTTDEAVIAQGMHILRLLVPFYETYICVEILSGVVRGAGAALVPALITLFGICVLRVVWILVVLPMFHTLDTVLYSYPITWILTSILFIIYYLKGSWLSKGRKRMNIEEEAA
jgi:methionine-S-sulfoxide reductase